MMKPALTLAFLVSVISLGHACSTWTKIKCAATVVRCAVTCKENGITSQQCISCFGGLYDECKSCLPIFEAADNLFTAVGPQNQTCGALDWFQCTSELDVCSVACNPDFTAASCGACLGETYGECVNCAPQLVAPNMTQQLSLSSCGPWDYIKCAVTVARCASTCSENGITSSQCISCFGSLYDQCIHCLPLETAVQANNPVQGCNTYYWIKCFGSLFRCSYICIRYGIQSPQCQQCLGPARGQCEMCITDEDMEDINQFRAAQLAQVAGNGSGTLNTHGLWTTVILVTFGLVAKTIII